MSTSGDDEKYCICSYVCQILGLMSGKYCVHDDSDIVLYSLGDGQPVQRFEHWSYVVTPCSTCHNAFQIFLNALEFVPFFPWRVAVVEPGVDYAACNHIGHVSVEHWTNMRQSPDVEISGFNDVLYVRIECEA